MPEVSKATTLLNPASFLPCRHMVLDRQWLTIADRQDAGEASNLRVTQGQSFVLHHHRSDIVQRIPCEIVAGICMVE